MEEGREAVEKHVGTRSLVHHLYKVYRRPVVRDVDEGLWRWGGVVVAVVAVPLVQLVQKVQRFHAGTKTEKKKAMHLGTELAPFLHSSPALTGALCYGAGILSLTLWDHLVLPHLLRRLSPTERAQPFVTPLTAMSAVPPPTLDELVEREKHFVGHSATLRQFITLDPDLVPLEDDVCEKSDEWSEWYDTDVYVFKVKK